MTTHDTIHSDRERYWHTCVKCKKRIEQYTKKALPWALVDPIGRLCPSCYGILHSVRARIRQFTTKEFAKFMDRESK